MTFKEWLTQFCKDQGIKETYPAFDKLDMLDCWNAAREDLLKEMYTLRKTNKEVDDANL